MYHSLRSLIMFLSFCYLFVIYSTVDRHAADLSKGFVWWRAYDFEMSYGHNYFSSTGAVRENSTFASSLLNQLKHSLRAVGHCGGICKCYLSLAHSNTGIFSSVLGHCELIHIDFLLSIRFLYIHNMLKNS